jgi:hypothetical protein
MNISLSGRAQAFFLAASMAVSFSLLWSGASRAENASVKVVVGPKADELERYGADELCGYMRKLFDIHVEPSTEIKSGTGTVLLIGSPETNPAVARALGPDGWPKVSDQGIVLKHAQLDGHPVLVIGGGSARATMWAVYELVGRWGVNYLLHGDVLPERAGEFRLPEKDVVMEPKFAARGWRVVNDLADGPEGWGINDYKPVIDQLAKLKFNRIFAAVYPWQPFIDLKYGNIQRKNAYSWYNLHYPITDDMPGRELFGNQTEFWNPDLPRSVDYDASIKAGQQHLRSIFKYAKSRGFEIGMSASIGEFPKEFAPLLKDYRTMYAGLGNLDVTPGPKQPIDDPAMLKLSGAVIESTLNTYPELDFIAPHMPEIPEWSEAYHKAWKALDAKYDLESRFPVDKILDEAGHRRGYAGVPERPPMEVKAEIAALYLIDKLITEEKVIQNTKQPNATLIYTSMAEEMLPVFSYLLPKISPRAETMNVLDYTPDRIVARPEAFSHAGKGEVRHNLIFTLHDDNVGMLPASNNDSLAILADRMRENGWAGFMMRYWLIGDHDQCMAFLARRSWDDEATPEKVYREQLAALCGPAAVNDLMKMFGELETVTRDMNQNAFCMVAATPGSSIDNRHWVPEPLPPQLVDDQKHYRRALEWAQKAHGKVSERGKRYTNYWLGRLQFGIGYFDCASIARQLVQAKVDLEQAKKSGDANQIAEKRRIARDRAEAGAQAARDTIEAFARVAQDQSDRGTVAVMGEYLYRPFKREAEALK